MPGHFNTTNAEDGGFASTSATDHVGIFGSNEATGAPSGGGAGGSGVFGLTVSAGAAGVFGANNSQKGVGVQGNGPDAGLSGFSDKGVGVVAHSNHSDAVAGFAHDPNGNAMLANNLATTSPTISDGPPRGNGILAVTAVPGAAGVFGANNSAKGIGVQGNGPERGVSGFSDAGSGSVGQSNKGSGVLATSGNGQGVTAFSDNDIGVFGQGATFSAVFNGALVVNKGPNPKDPGKPPSDINGSLVINDGNLFLNTGGIFLKKGDIVLSGADCAENFDVSAHETIEPGTVMVINAEGGLQPSDRPYDKRVAGVISGAGSYRPGIVLDNIPSEHRRLPLALMGKVYCKVDAQYATIDVGDLLTTSPTPGHAMKADDRDRAFGAVIGKALRAAENGQDLIPVLVSLQ